MKALFDYLGGLTVTQGQGIGDPFKLLPWERKFVKGAFNTSGDAGLSVGRGNGKTTFIAGIGAAAVDDDGPLVQTRAETVIVASSFDQGKIDFNHILAFLEAKGHDLTDRKHWRVQDSVNKAVITNKKNKATVKCIGSDPKRAHGLAPLLVIADEPAQWEAAKSDAMYAALRTGMGKIPGSRLIALGTRPDDPDHWFEKLLQGGAGYSQVHAADQDDPIFQAATWRKANPSLKAMPALLERIREEAKDAKKDSALLPSFKALRLNLGVSDVEIRVLLEADTWGKAEGEAEQAGEYVLGLDLGTTAAMSAAAGYWIDTGALEALACFGNIPSLPKRGLQDGVGSKYQLMHSRGEVILSEGRTSKIPDLLNEVLERWGRPVAIVCDRWREGELLDHLDNMRFPGCELVTRGMGWQDGGEDVRAFRKAILEDEVIPAKSLLMRYAMGEARVIADPAGNEKLAKSTQGGRRARARDDAVAAGILAIAEGYRRLGTRVKRPGWRYAGMV